MSHTPSPSPRPHAASVSRSSHDKEHGSALQATVENERQDVLSDVKEQNAQQFGTVESLHEKLTETTESAMDMFKREPPRVIQSQSAAAVTEPLQTKAIDYHTSKTAAAAAAAAPVSANAVSHTVPLSAVSNNLHVNDDLDHQHVSHVNGGFEKNTAIIQHKRKPTVETDEKEAQIQSLTLALIQTRQAYRELQQTIYQTDEGAAVVGVDARDADISISASSLLTTVPTMTMKEKSLHSFLADLPVKLGWLMMRTGHTGASPTQYTKYFFTLNYDGLYYCESEYGTRGTKIDLEHYWLIEKTEDKSRKHQQHNYAAPSASLSSAAATATAAASASGASAPIAGASVFRLEDGAYIIRLVPVIHHEEHPETILEPSRSQVIELTGASESDVSDSSALSAWADAINLRISLLSLATHPQCTQILSHGGREVLSFLCSVDQKTLIIENRYIDAALVFSYFKETLIHRQNWSLILKNVGLNDGGVKVITEILMLNSSIYHINLSYNSITDTGASYIATVFEVNGNIQSVDLSFTQIGPEGLIELATAIAKHAVSSITYRGNHVNDKSFNTFYETLKASASALRSFALLDFSSNDLSDASAPTLSNLFSSFVISALKLSQNAFSDAALQKIVASVGENSTALQSLTLLDLSYNKLTSAALPELVNLFNYVTAASVDMSGNMGITTSGLVPLINSGMDLSVDVLRLKKRPTDSAAAESSSSSSTLTSEGASVSKNGNNSSKRPAAPARRLSITKETAAGKVEVIDPLHPRNENQLGRSVDEVSEEDKSNSISPKGTTLAATGLPSATSHPPVSTLLDRLAGVKGKGSDSSPRSSSPSASPGSSGKRSRSNSLSAHSSDDKLQVLDVPHTAASTELLVDGGKTADPRAVLAGSHSRSSSTGVHVDTESADARALATEAAAEGEAAKHREVARTQHSSHSSVVTAPQSMFSASGLQAATPQQIEKKQADAALKGKYPQTDLNNNM